MLADFGDCVEINVVRSGEPTESPTDTPLWSALERAARRAYPDAHLLASPLTGATDARWFRRAGIPAYGFGLLSRQITPQDYWSRFHGNDERIDVESLRPVGRHVGAARPGLPRTTSDDRAGLRRSRSRRAAPTAVVEVAKASGRRCCRRGSPRWTSRSQSRSDARSSPSPPRATMATRPTTAQTRIEAVGAARLRASLRLTARTRARLQAHRRDARRDQRDRRVHRARRRRARHDADLSPVSAAIVENGRRIVEAPLRPIDEGCALDVDALDRAADRRSPAALVQPAQPVRSLVHPQRARRRSRRSSSSTTSSSPPTRSMPTSPIRARRTHRSRRSAPMSRRARSR